MNCDDTQKQLPALHDGELDAESARSVVDHIEGCASCAGTLAELDDLRAYVRRHGRSPLPAGLLSRIEERAGQTVVTTDQAVARTGAFGAWLLPRLAAAAFGALCVGGAWWFSDSGHSTAPLDLREPVARYLRATNVTTTLDELERLRRRPENRVLAWARQEAKKR